MPTGSAMAQAAFMGVSVDDGCVGESASSLTPSSPPSTIPSKVPTEPILCKPQISQEMDSGIENMDMDEYPASLGVILEKIRYKSGESGDIVLSPI